MIRRVLLALLLCPLLAGAEPGLYSPNCRQGETFVRVLTWRDSAGSLVNLTGYAAKLQLRDTVTHAVVDSWTESDGLTLGGSAGTITWTISATETAALAAGSHAYDLRLTSGGGTVTYLLYGYLNVTARVTQ